MVHQCTKILLTFGAILLIRDANAGKRLVLHSDDDIIQKVLSLEQDIQGMKTELAAKDQAIAVLNQTLSQKSASLATVEQTVQGLQTELTAKTLEISTLQQSFSQALGSTYVRWGRTTCGGNSSQLVYKGYTGGPYYGESGNGANMLCLPEHPTWAQLQTGYNGGHIYGTEYDPNFKQFNTQHWEDLPCSVCRTTLPTTIMMPASTQCSSGWTMQYTGYLLSNHYTHAHPSEYICVDEHPEPMFHGERDEAGPELCVVNAKCGTLPCQVYPDGQQLACSVCSK